MKPRLGYIVSRFPHLPETFILREMVELERLGWSISLYPLISQKQPVIHPDALVWDCKAQKAGFFSPRVWIANIQMLFHSPGRYIQTWFRMARLNIKSPSFFVRALILFPKAVWIASQMQAEGIEHIHAHYASHPALAAWIIHQLTGIRYSVTIHAHDIFVNRTMLEQKMRDAALIVAISEFNREYLSREVGGWVRSKTKVVHCGISPDWYHPQMQSARLIDQSAFRLVTIGSLQPYKGQEVLIRSCKRLVDLGIPVHCDIIGEGELKEPLQRIIQSYGLEERVILKGALTQEEIAQKLPEYDCYVQPSIITPSGKMEGIPLAIMEAMACNLPVVASDISGIPELVQPGITGYLVPSGDDLALANQLAGIFADRETARCIAQRGLEKVQQDFNISTQAAALGNLFEALS